MKKIFIGGLALALLGFLAIDVPAQGLIEPIFACVNSNDGTARIIDPSITSCKKNETLISWPRVDTNTDTLGALVCAAGQVPLRDASGAWVCGTIAPDQDTLADLSCTAGQTVKWDGTAWVCETSSTLPRFEIRTHGGGVKTVFDNTTGLEWEMKEDCTDAANPHCKGNTYDWSKAGSDHGTLPDGTLFTDFLPKLNNATGSFSIDGNTLNPPGCYAGHCDWYIPDIVQLKTILIPWPECVVAPCIDLIFGPTQPNEYWSSTTSPCAESSNPNQTAWEVTFFRFRVQVFACGGKLSQFYARAVRGGR